MDWICCESPHRYSVARLAVGVDSGDAVYLLADGVGGADDFVEVQELEIQRQSGAVFADYRFGDNYRHNASSRDAVGNSILCLGVIGSLTQEVIFNPLKR